MTPIEIPHIFNKTVTKYLLSLTDKIYFGKYKNLTIEEIIIIDYQYIDFLIKNSGKVSFTKEVKDKIKFNISSKKSLKSLFKNK